MDSGAEMGRSFLKRESSLFVTKVLLSKLSFIPHQKLDNEG